MRIVTIGGGPGALYLAILLKRADPSHEVTVLERNRPDDTFGFGVVFSDATLENFAAADRETYREITRSLAHWDDIDIHAHGQVLTSTGHGFAGLARQRMLDILHRRCRRLGVRLEFQTDVRDLAPYRDYDLVVGADGVNSLVRQRYAERFEPAIDWRPNRFAWMGTTFPYQAFAFIFKKDAHGGLWCIHAYRYDRRHSTFIPEATEETWRRAGLERASEAESARFLEALFERELAGHRLLTNRSVWRMFPTVQCARWHWDNVVLIGDAAHTVHFSIGSGTKLAMEDAIALAQALASHRDVGAALRAYEAERRPVVESLQRAAQVSLEWFEAMERYHERLEPAQVAFSLLTRSLRVTHGNLKVRDPKFVETVDRWFAAKAADQSGVATAAQPLPPMFTPFRLRGLTLDNRVVVSPMCQYSAEDGTPGDWHLVNLGSRAVGGAALVVAEMTDVSRDGRITPGCTGMYQPEHVAAWKRIVDYVHRWTPAKVALQLAHAGRKGSTRVLWEGMDEPLAEGNWPLISASPIPYLPESQVPKAMDRADMDLVREQFTRAARMAEAAGFDMLELHMAHGYLLASFISPLTNVRADEYGGPIANRMRYPLEVFDAVRAVWPVAKPLSVKISATDWAEGGLTPEDCVALARMLAGRGCDLITVSTGQTVPWQRPRYGRLYQTPFADMIRHEAGIATATVGNIASWDDANSILAAGRADLCVLARGHLYDPYWTRHAAAEQGVDLRWPEQYVSVKSFTPRPPK